MLEQSAVRLAYIKAVAFPLQTFLEFFGRARERKNMSRSSSVVFSKLHLQILYFCMGFLFYYFASAPSTGARNRLDRYLGWSSSLRFYWQCSAHSILVVHVHHWLYLLAIVAYSYNSFLTAFCLGGVVQGLTYSDWYKVISFSRVHI